jgi:hypothetical protein
MGGRRASKTLTGKIEPKLFRGSGFAISGIGHMAILALGLIFAGANPFDSAPVDAITVEIVSPNEVDAGSSNPGTTPAGSQEAAPSSEPAAERAATTPQPQPTPPSTPQATPPPDLRATRQALVSTQAVPSPPPSFIPWQQPPPEPSLPAETYQINPGDMFGMPLTLPGGVVGYEHPGEATEKPNITDDVIAAFRKHLKTCSILPAGVGAGARVTLRIQLNPDGTLTRSPENPHAVGLVIGLSEGSGPLFMAAMAAVRKCQPYKMLPPDKYNEWKVFDLSFTPQNFGGG